MGGSEGVQRLREAGGRGKFQGGQRKWKKNFSRICKSGFYLRNQTQRDRDYLRERAFQAARTEKAM